MPDQKKADSSLRRRRPDGSDEWVGPKLLRMFHFGKGWHPCPTQTALFSKAMKIRKKRPAAKLRQRSRRRGTPSPKREAARPRRLPALLHHVEKSSLSDLAPGDIWLIEEAATPSPSTQGAAPVFFAVLGCPLCGAPTLITLAQYFGVSPVMCRSQVCAALFRIADQNRFVYLPVN